MSPNTPGTPRRTIRIPDPLWLAAVAAAKERDESLSEEIRRFLRRYVRRSKWAAGTDDGMSGWEVLPEDRSAWQKEAERAVRLATVCPKCHHGLGRHTPTDICADCLAACDGFHGVNP